MNSNAQSMRDYRSRIRADPVRYEEYKARERVRNKKRCEKRRLEKLAKKGIFPGSQEMADYIERTSRNSRLHYINSKQKAIDQIEMDDSIDEEDSSEAQLPLSFVKCTLPGHSSDEDNDFDHNKDEANTDIKYSLESLFADLEQIVNKRLPTKEISISIPKPNNSHSRRPPSIDNNKYLPEIDIFVNDPRTLTRVPINGLPALPTVQSIPKQQNRKKIPMLPCKSSSSMMKNDVVDLTSDVSDDDNEHNSNTNEMDIHLVHPQLEPEIEIVEYPPMDMNSSQKRNFNENSSNNSTASTSRSSVSSTDPPPGYIDSFMTFVSRQMEDEEREIILRRLMRKRMQQHLKP